MLLKFLLYDKMYELETELQAILTYYLNSDSYTSSLRVSEVICFNLLT